MSQSKPTREVIEELREKRLWFSSWWEKSRVTVLGIGIIITLIINSFWLGGTQMAIQKDQESMRADLAEIRAGGLEDREHNRKQDSAIADITLRQATSDGWQAGFEKFVSAVNDRLNNIERVIFSNLRLAADKEAIP
jgi:hypothetical protein